MYRTLLCIAATLLTLDGWAGEGNLQGRALLKDPLGASSIPASAPQGALVASASDQSAALQSLKSEISKIRKELNMRALALAIVDTSGVIWAEDLSDEASGDSSSTHTAMRFPVGYVSTIFVGLSVLRLVEDGRLDLNDRVSDLAPELVFDNPWELTHPLRLVHLLEHTAGWDSRHFAEFYMPGRQTLSLIDALNEYTLSRRSRWPPGTRNSNKSIGPVVAAYIVERVSGQSFESFVRQNFFAPIGMRSATYQPNQATVMRDKAVKLKSLKTTRYRPLNSVYASTEDMTKFLHFLLMRGEINGKPVLSPAAFDRMEVSLSTLGSEKGTFVAHGLTSSMTGHGNYGIAFFGHRSELTELAYSPELKKGFYISATSDVKGIRLIARKIKTYLLRNHEQLIAPSKNLPDEFRQMDGYYKRTSGFAERNKFVSDLVGITRVRTTDNLFLRSPLLGNFETKDYFESGQALINSWTGLPTVAIVDDPIEGTSLQAWVSYKKIPALLVFGRLIFVAFFTLATVLSIGFLSFRLIKSARGKAVFCIALLPEFWSLSSAILLITTIVLFFFVGNTYLLGVKGGLSLSLFYLSSAYGASAVLGLLFAAYSILSAKNRSVVYVVFALCVMHGVFALMLNSYDLIAMRTWTM